jgi:hypothetical protein
MWRKADTFRRKTYGRIFVTTEDHIDRVKGIILMMDSDEYEYMPDTFVAVWDEKLPLIYGHKFDWLNIYDLTTRCWNAGIPVWCITGRDQDGNDMDEVP